VSVTDNVRPDHPELIDYWQRHAPVPDPVAAALEFVGRFRYVPRRGRVPLEETLRRREGNCLALSSLFCSLLRGYPGGPVGAYVALGARRGFAHEWAHAWTFLPKSPGDRICVVDPNGWTSTTLSTNELLETLSIHVTFNESVFAFGDQWPVLLPWGAGDPTVGGSESGG